MTDNNEPAYRTFSSPPAVASVFISCPKKGYWEKTIAKLRINSVVTITDVRPKVIIALLLSRSIVN
jgi:hypothetical protein